MKRKRNGSYSTPAGTRLNIFLAVFLTLFLVSYINVSAQDELHVIQGESSNNNWLEFSDASNALYHHLADQAYQHLQQRKEKVLDLQTRSDWQRRQSEIHETFQDILGPFPEKTPLNARILRTVQKGSYRVEHIVYESQPDFFVTSSLFIPNDLPEKAPVVIYVSGHTANGYRSETYQHKILNLVDKNFIVFAFDPVGQGERLEYNIGEEVGSTTSRSPAGGHSYSGVQGYITGNSQARIMIWDGIRAVDYLLTRDEVDPDRIGITGRSGGGTQSSYIAALDERIYAAAPESYITNFKRLIQSIGPQDSEQNFAGGIAKGIDHGDLLAIRAPKPALLIATTEDYFSIQGARETAEEVSSIYSAYGRPGNFEMTEDFGEHGSTQKNRESMYSFFQEHLQNPGSSEDIDLEPLSEEEIQVTETGQVFTTFDGKTISDLNRELANSQVNELENSRDELDQHLEKSRAAAIRLSGYVAPHRIKDPVLTGRIQRDGYIIEKYFMMGEGDYPIPYLFMIPENQNGKAILYLHPAGKAADASELGRLEELVTEGFAVLAPDLIGIGELSPDNSSDLIKEWHASVLINRSIVGIQASDVVRLSKLLQQKYEFSEIYGIAMKEISPALLHAAAAEKNLFQQIALMEPLISYRSLVNEKYYDSKFIASTIAESMQSYDLPDLAAGFAPNKLLIMNPVNGANHPIDGEQLARDTQVMVASYADAQATENLTIIRPEMRTDMFQTLLNWITNP